MPQLDLFRQNHSPGMTAWLHEQREAAATVMRHGIPRTREQLLELSEREWEELGTALIEAMTAYVTMCTAMRGLPRSTVCVCPKCKTIGLARGALADNFGCCGLLLMPQGRLGHKPLPPDFWEHHRPGDRFKGDAQASWAAEGADDPALKKRRTKSGATSA